MILLTPQQRSVFQRAVQRRSRGQVRLPALDLGRCDAIARAYRGGGVCALCR